LKVFEKERSKGSTEGEGDRERVKEPDGNLQKVTHSKRRGPYGWKKSLN